MTFAHPWAFALAGLGVPLVLAYLHRKHRLRRTVASAILLRAIKDERPASARARARLRHRLSLVLIAIALGLGIIGLVGPEASSGHDGRIIIVLDRSASMATSDGAGDRLAHAIAAVGELAERANGDDEVAVVTAGGEPTIIASPTKDHGEVAAKAAVVTAGGDNRDDAVAFALADGLCRDPEHSKIVVVSDGTGLTVPPTRCPLESIAIGSDADNLGISGLSVHAVDGLGLYDVHVSVASTYPAPHHIDINLTSDGELVDVIGVDVPPRGDTDRTLRVTIEHGKTITAELPGGDALALDDRAEVPLSGVGPVSVLLVTARRHSLVAEALRLHPRVTLDQAAPGSLPTGPHDLIILEDDPKSSLPPSTHVVALGASPGDDAPIALGDAAAERGVVRWDFDSPWFRYVDLRDMILQSSRLVAGGRSVVDSSSGALVATAPWGDRELVVTGFSLDETDLTLRAAFPNLIANLVDWAAPRVAFAGPSHGVLDTAESHVTPKPLPGAVTTAPAVWRDTSWLARLAILLALGLIVAEQLVYSRSWAREVGVSFEHPWWLVVLVPAAAVAVYDALRGWNQARWQRAVAIACRAILVVALAGAAAEPRWSGHRRDTTVVFLIDRSASISDESLSGAWTKVDSLRSGLDRVAVVVFDAKASVAIAPGDPWTVPAQLRGSAGERDATNIAAAVRLGLGLIPPDTGGSLVLVGDGRANAGDLAAATSAAIARNIPISTFATGGVAGDPAVAAVVLDAERIHTGATLTGHVDIDAGGVTGAAKVSVKVGGVEVATKDVTLDGGHQVVPFTYSLPATQKPGVVGVDATLEVASGTTDRDAGNDRGSARLVVERPPHVVILDGDDNGAAPLAAALRAEQMEVTVVPAADSGPAPDLGTADLVILANAPVRGGVTSGVIDDELGKRLVRWVNDGGGLVVLGGPSALDGNYAANRLADALPVEIEPMTPELDASATVVIILDESGSMGEVVSGQTKLALAAEGAAAVIRLLRSFDHVAVEAVEDRVHWTVPLREIGSDTALLEQKVRGIEVGGDGIFIYTGLVAARDVLEHATTPLKHVILFSDTTDAAEQIKGIDYGDWYGWPGGPNTSFAIAKQLRDKGVTLSVIGVGDGADGPFNPATYVDDEDDSDWLRELAKQGGGRYYRTSDAKQLRGLFVQDARKLLDTHAHEEDISLKIVARYPALEGVDLEHAPKLHGFQEVKPRPAAQVVVTDTNDDPILTRWPYGLGEVAVWASDAGPRWAKDWLAWPGYARFWTQMARSALRRREGDTTAIETDFTGDTATVRVVRRSDTGVTASVPRARVVEQGSTRDLPLRVVEPGVFDTKVAVVAGHEPTVELLDDQGAVVDRRTLARPASTELRQRGPDAAALAALAKQTGGHESPSSITAEGRDVQTSTPLAPWLLLLALLLVPVDASLRRLAREPRVVAP